MLLEQTNPSATTGVLIGPVPPDLGERLQSYAHVAWIADAASLGAPPAAVRPGAVEVVPLATAATDGFGKWIDRFAARNARQLPSLFVSDGILTRETATYEQVITTLHRALEAHHRARVTRQQDGFTWQRHLLENLATYAQRRLPAAWQGALHGWPAFVCGAGPSLDQSAPVLARFAAGGIVLAADSALTKLAKLEVRADMVVSVDAAKLPEKCLPPGFVPPLAALSALSPPSWQTALPLEHQVYLSSNQLTLGALATKGLALTEVAAVENCGATALLLARFLGCAPIYLFGLDLALDPAQPARRHHGAVDASLYTRSGFDSTQSFPHVPGNFSDTVPTHVLGDWNTLDQRLTAWPPGLVFNVTDRGAKLSNTTVVRPEDFAPAVPSEPKASALARLPQVSPPAVPAEAFQMLRTAGDQARQAMPALRSALQREGPAGVVAQLRPLFANENVGRSFGAFSLKLMPHLMPPEEGDVAFWKSLLDEFESLARLASRTNA